MSDSELRLQFRLTRGAFRLEVDERLPANGTTAVFGPSGAGKSSLLLAIAGFERPDEGRIALGDEVWFDGADGTHLAAHKRGVGYVFQDGRLFPHRTVAGNLRYAQARAPAGGPHLVEVVDALDLGDLMDRRPSDLSGGEHQRAALARTLLTHPKLLLLDEPLAALDAARKQAILPYLQTIQARFQLPTLYVSHSLDECAQLASRMLALEGGQIAAHGPLPSVVETLDLASTDPDLDASAILTARVDHVDADAGIARLDIGDGRMLTAPNWAGVSAGDEARLRIRARDVAIALGAPQRISIQNCLKGEVVEIRNARADHHVDVLIALGDQRIRARITSLARRDLELEPGRPVYALVKAVSFQRR